MFTRISLLTFANGASDIRHVWVAGDFPGDCVKQNNQSIMMNKVVSSLSIPLACNT